MDITPFNKKNKHSLSIFGYSFYNIKSIYIPLLCTFKIFLKVRHISNMHYNYLLQRLFDNDAMMHLRHNNISLFYEVSVATN